MNIMCSRYLTFILFPNIFSTRSEILSNFVNGDVLKALDPCEVVEIWPC